MFMSGAEALKSLGDPATEFAPSLTDTALRCQASRHLHKVNLGLTLCGKPSIFVRLHQANLGLTKRGLPSFLPSFGEPSLFVSALSLASTASRPTRTTRTHRSNDIHRHY